MRHLPGKIAVLGLSLVCTTAVPAAEPAGQMPRPTLETLIGNLGDKNFRIRQAAGKTLEQRGEEALPALRQAVENSDEEVRRRVEVLTQKIERTVLLSPKRVTLQMKDRPITEIIKELARQSGYKLHYQGGRPGRMTIDVQNATYWEALDKICYDAALTTGFDDAQGIVYLYQQDATSPYTYHSGPFRFVATHFNYNRTVNLANIPRNGQDPNNQFDNNLNFGFMIQSEPKAPLLSVGAPKLSKAVDENGISLLPRQGDIDGPFNVQFYDGSGMFRNFQHSTNAQLCKPIKEATKAKLIKGTVSVTILSATRPDVVLDKLAVGKKKLAAAGQTAEVAVEELTEQNKTYCLTLQIQKIVRQGEPQDFNWINGLQQKLELCDAKGNKYLSQGVNNFINNTATSVHAIYQFAPPPNAKIGPPVRLVLNRWVSIAQELEFEFKDLPLP